MANKNLEVSLIAMPENLLDVIYTACRTCYSADGAVEIFNNITDDNEKKLALIKRIIASGHYSTIEHIQVTFAINNISRAATHQLVRHRHMSFSQKSQRYVKEAEFDYITPMHIKTNPELNAKFIKEATAAGFVNLKGHRSVGGMRASIYNAMPIEGVEKLVAFMAEFERNN